MMTSFAVMVMAEREREREGGGVSRKAKIRCTSFLVFC